MSVCYVINGCMLGMCGILNNLGDVIACVTLLCMYVMYVWTVLSVCM